MRKNLFTIGLLATGVVYNAQYISYVGQDAIVSVQDQSLVYNGGGMRVVQDGTVSTIGDIMIVGKHDDATAPKNKLTLDANSNFVLKHIDTSTYGQLYINHIEQTDITGIVKKEHKADVNNGDTARQQMSLPFYGYKASDLATVLASKGLTLNLTNTAISRTGRFSNNSIFRWNNERSRFDQITTNTELSPTDYIIIPRRNAGQATPTWNPATDLTTFEGIPVSDMRGNIADLGGANIYGTNDPGLPIRTSYYPVEVKSSTLTGNDFGVKGSNRNYFRESYASYLYDPFSSDTDWQTDYGKKLMQLANPFFTNINLYNFGNNAFFIPDNGGGAYDPRIIIGIAYYNKEGLKWDIDKGTDAVNLNNNILYVYKTNGTGEFQAGDIDTPAIIKPMQEFLIKFEDTDNINPEEPNTKNWMRLGDMRTFSQTGEFVPQNYNIEIIGPGSSYGGKKSTSGKKAVTSTIPADKLVRQLAVEAYNSAGEQIGRTYYAVSPSSINGASSDAILQTLHHPSERGVIFTKEELPSGGEDTEANYSLLINEANEVTYRGKEIPMVVDSKSVSTLKFVIYEGGKRVDALSNGINFYIGQDNTVTELYTGMSLPASTSQYKLYYDTPTIITLDTSSANAKAQTIVAKKQDDWVVRFASSWKLAKIEVYSAAGRLIHSQNNVSTSTDYVIPADIVTNGLFIVKAISETGEVVTKKIVK